MPVHNNPWTNNDEPEFPKEYECQARRHLTKSLSQPQYTRPDIWFVSDNEIELPSIIKDAKNVISEVGFQWFDELLKLHNALDVFQNRPETYMQKSIALEMLGGNLNSMARADVVSGIALESGNIELAKSTIMRVRSNPFYTRQIDSIKILDEKLSLLEQLAIL